MHWTLRGRWALLGALLCWISGPLSAESSSRTHAHSLYGEVKYPPDFAHFDYVNPKAPKGGEIRLAASGTFDSLHSFSIKGLPARGLGMLYDSLTEQALDEPSTEYGLIAETIERPEHGQWVGFHLRAEAAWHDGRAISAEDVRFSFEVLTQQLPLYRHYYADVDKVEVVGPREVRFHFKPGSNRELALIVGQLPVLPKHYWQDKDLSKSTLEPPLGSGPYKIDQVDPGRSIRYVRVENYWGKDLPINVGRYNLDAIRYEYYRDDAVAFEAFKAGELDHRQEHASKRWATGYQTPAVEKGWIRLESLPNAGTKRMQAFTFNTRKPLFKDPRVREALGYAFDFQWSNKNLFYGAYQRTDSYFLGGGLRASGTPSEAERTLLEPFADQLPKALFEQPFRLPKTDGSGRIRAQMRSALRLLKQAGWAIKARKLTHVASGEVMQFELLLRSPSMERVALPFKKNLERLGVDMRVRMVDTAQYIKRMDQFDFDMTVAQWFQSMSPGNEQREMWGSAAAAQTGSRNYAGIQSPVVDALIETIIGAEDREQLRTATQALDRVLLWGHYVIPQWYASDYRLAYWDRYAHPPEVPIQSLGFPSLWWWDAEKASALAKARKR